MKALKKERWFILVTFLVLTLFGLLMVYESSSVYAFKSAPGQDPAYFFKKQLLFFFVAISLFLFTLIIDLEYLKRYSKEFFLFTLIILTLLIFFGREAGGAKRWFSLAGLNVQPSEILKLSFLLYCADYFRRKKTLLRNFKTGLLPLGIVSSLIFFLLILQPDLGGAIFWVIWLIFFLFLFGARKKHLISIVLIGIIISFFLIKVSPYRFERIVAYINPFADPRGSGFQLVQSQIAYGEGGIWGVGFGQGRQKLSFLPAGHTDFVFSIIAEEFGIIGSFGLIFIFLLLFKKMYLIAKQSHSDFGSALLWGIIFIFFLEISINLGVSCGLLPTKGLPLPFMSYGGSSLVVHYILLGLFFNASRIEEKTAKLQRR